MRPTDLILECNIEDLSNLHGVLDSLESVDVREVSVNLLGPYRPGCASEVMAFCTGCALRSRQKRLTFFGGKLHREIEDPLWAQELAATDSSWARVSAELQALRPHDVAVDMLATTECFFI